MDNKILIFSVIIPTYNRSEFLSRAIKSVLSQTFQDFEVIVVDDCSNDSTPEIMKNFQKQDQRIKYIRLEENSGGPAKPRNMGAKNAGGKYLVMLDDDDELLPQSLDLFFSEWDNVKKSDNIGTMWVRCLNNNEKLNDLGFPDLLNFGRKVQTYQDRMKAPPPKNFEPRFILSLKKEVMERFQYEESVVGIEGIFNFRASKKYNALIVNRFAGRKQRGHKKHQLTGAETAFKNAESKARGYGILLKENKKDLKKYNSPRLGYYIKAYIFNFLLAGKKKEARAALRAYKTEINPAAKIFFYLLSFFPTVFFQSVFSLRAKVKKVLF